MADERERILRMVADGKLSAQEAKKLLDALETGGGGRKRRTLHVYVDEPSGEKVDIRLPLSVVRMAKNLIPHSAMVKIDQQDVDLSAIFDAVEAGELSEDGEIVNIESADGTEVRITVE